MNEWIKVRNDACQALSQAQDRLRELRERFKNTKKKLYQLNVYLVRAEQARERALVAYSTNPRSVPLQEALTAARENVTRTRQEVADLEAMMEASKAEYRFLYKEIPLLNGACSDAQKLFWFALFEQMEEKIRQSVGAEIAQAYAAYAASFAEDLSYEAFLQRVLPNTSDAQRQAEMRDRLLQDFPMTQSQEPAAKSLAPPDPLDHESLPSPGDEARQWANRVRG